MPAASFDLHVQATIDEASPQRSVTSRGNEHPECLDSAPHCGPIATHASNAHPIQFLSLVQRTRFFSPPAVLAVAAPDVAPPPATSLSILFRNFRK